MRRLFTTPMSANGRKVHALAHHLELALEVVDVNVYRGEGQAASFRAINPLGRVPTLVDGDLTLTESNAILIYLSEVAGAGQLWSTDAKTRAEIARWLFWESAHWQPVVTAALQHHAGHIMVPAHVPEPSTPPAWDAEPLHATLAYLQAHLEARPFLAGEALTLADFSVAAMTIFFPRLAFPFEAYPAIRRWFAAVHGLDAWRAVNLEPWTCPIPHEPDARPATAPLA